MAPGDGGNSFSVAWFVTPHGFGHAARASALMEALSAIEPQARHEIFSSVPPWFFGETLGTGFGYHRLESDVGLVQAGPFLEDLEKTLLRLAAFYPPPRETVAGLAAEVRALGCRLVVCDISPLGIAVAGEAGLPSVLVENFTWDWIYRGYEAADGRFGRFADITGDLFAKADRRIRCTPACGEAAADITVPPVARRFRAPREETRRALGVPEGDPMVLLTSGGIPAEWSAIDEGAGGSGAWIVVPGGAAERQLRGRLVLLPHHSGHFHPDLVNAADAVVGKIGYSTLAEVWHAGVPFGYISRRLFREARVLCDFVEERMTGIEIPEAKVRDGTWAALLPELLALPRRRGGETGGADEAAALLL